MKRIISVLMIFSVLLSFIAITPVYADEADTTVEISSRLESARNLLAALDLMKIKEDSEYAKGMTRADFAIVIGNIMGIDEYAPTDKRYFVDVPSDHWALNSINELVERGYFSVGDDKIFRPDDIITSAEASKVIMTLLGYGNYCKEQGGYPYGYLNLAGQSGVYDGVNISNAMTVGDVTVAIYNALHITILEETQFISLGDDVFSIFNNNSGKTLLSKYYDIYFANGTVESVWGAAVSGEPVKEHQIKINGKVFSIDNVDYLEYLGLNVTLYYESDEINDINTVVHIRTRDSKNDVVKFDRLLFSNFNTSTYVVSYYKDEEARKASSINVSKGVVIVKNGEKITGSIKDAFDVNKGTFTFIDADNDGVYEVAIVKEYRNVIASYIDDEDMIVYDMFGGSVDLYPHLSSKAIRIKNASGSAVSFSSIKAGNILTVFDSADYVEVFISDKYMEGTVFEVEAVGDETRILLGSTKEDAVWMLYDKDYVSIENQDPTMGVSGTFYMDIYGIISYCDYAGNADELCAYLVLYGEPKGLGNAKLKLFNQKGKMEILEVKNGVRIDGVRCGSSDKIKEALKKGRDVLISNRTNAQCTDSTATTYYIPDTVAHQVIKYKVDENNVITQIDTCYDAEQEDHSAIKVSYSVTYSYYRYKQQMFGNVGAVDTGKTVMFSIPNENVILDAEDKDFKMFPTGLKSNRGAQGGIDLYKTDLDSGYADVAVARGYGSQTNYYEADMALISKVSEAINDDGEYVTRIKYWIKSAENTVDLSKDCVTYKLIQGTSNTQENYTQWQELDDEPVGTGDIVRLGMNSDGDVNVVYKLYDYSKSEKATLPPNWSYEDENGVYYGEHKGSGFSVSSTSTYEFTYAELLSKRDGILKFDFHIGSDKDTAVEEKAARSGTITSVIVFDTSAKEGNNVSESSISALVEKRITGEGTRVFYRSQSAVTKWIIYYK